MDITKEWTGVRGDDRVNTTGDRKGKEGKELKDRQDHPIIMHLILRHRH